MDSWDDPSGTPGGCCEYSFNMAFSDVEVDEIGYGEASGKKRSNNLRETS